MSKNAYKVVLVSLMSAVMVAYTNCGNKTDLKFVSSAQQSAGKVEAFSSTVHSITKANCAGCHSPEAVRGTTPFHAAANAEEALTAIEDTHKINWSSPESSRLVAKLRDENHNCWSDCAENAQEMLDAILKMKDMMASAGEDLDKANDDGKKYIATSQSRAIQTELNDTSNPQKSNTVRLNVEAAMLTAPMAIVRDATRGAVLTVPQTKQTELSPTAPSAGVAYMNFDVRVAGSYRVWMYTNAPSTNDNGFFVKFDNQTVQTFDPTVNGTDYGWMLVPNSQRNLTVGRHTLEVREKKDGTKVNSIIVTADTAFNGTDVGSYVGVTLTYDLSGILKSPNIKLMVDIADYDPYSYKLLNPRIISPTVNVKVKNMRILLNKSFNPQNSAYTTVDKVITAADPEVSPFSTVIAKDKGLNSDKLSFEFEELEVTTGTGATGGTGGGTMVDPVASLNAYRTGVYAVSRANCMSCHTTQFPQHASNNAQIAHDILLDPATPMIDFDSPTNSRLYRKVKVNRHNCGSNANCDNIAAQFLSGINAWGTARGY